MKQIKEFINEKLIINKNTKIDKYHYHPKNRTELEKLVKKLIKERGNEADLNDIDTSKIKNMNALFKKSVFDGNISDWDVSNIEYMGGMFYDSEFTGKNNNFSNWDVSNVKDMSIMFAGSKFTGEKDDLLNWNVSSVEYMSRMFDSSKFNGDISNWKLKNYCEKYNLFDNCPLEKNPPKWYK